MENTRNKILVISATGFLIVMTLLCLFHGNSDYSMTERRYLKQFPAFTWDSVMNGRFMTDFEGYSQDQFPGRDAFRGIKSGVSFYVFGQKDNNDLYIADGYIGKLEYPYREESVNHAVKVFQSIYDKYLADSDCKTYYAIIPDKGYFLAKENGYLAMDYETMVSDMQAGMPNMTYIDLFEVMELKDYYRTDTHWRQEEITDVAEYVALSMGKDFTPEFEIYQLEDPFYGVYHGQLALPMQGETLYYLKNDTLEDCYVYDYTEMQEINIYDMEKARGADPYEMYLSGSLSLITIENPNADSDDELIVFRDSFGSSIAPLWVEGYKKITLIDIRYLYSGMLGNYIDFENQDVLFLYSTLVLNHSETLK